MVDCYPSFDGKKLKDLLPIPKEVTENVIISEHLNLKGGNLAGITKSDPFGPAGDPKASVTLEGVLAAARQGIPQGSAVSPLIAETILAIALREVPKLGDIVAYGDNCLLLAKNESDMVTMTEALETALKAHPVGLLTPKRKRFLPRAEGRVPGSLSDPTARWKNSCRTFRGKLEEVRKRHEVAIEAPEIQKVVCRRTFSGKA